MSLPAALRDLRLRPGYPVGERLAEWCERLAVHAELCGEKEQLVPAVHQLRLVAKALRAAIRLADSGAPGPDLVRQDAAIRRWAAGLGSMRDSAVQGALMRHLVRREDRLLRDTVDGIVERWEPRPPDAGLRRRSAVQLAQSARAVGPKLMARADAPGIRKALRRSLRKSLAWREAAEEEGAMEAFHAWRRWQKRLEFQLRLAASGSTRRLNKQLDRLHRLQEELGALHDVDQLAVRMRSRPIAKLLNPERRKRIDSLLQQRQSRLQRRVLRLAKKAVDRELGDRVRSIARLWAKSKVNRRKPPASTAGSPSRSVRVPPRT